MKNELIVIDYCDNFFPNYFLYFLKDLKNIKIKKTYISIKPDYQLGTTKIKKIIYIKNLQVVPMLDSIIEEVLKEICKIADKHEVSLRISTNEFIDIYYKCGFISLKNSNYFYNDFFRFQEKHIIVNNYQKKYILNWNLLTKAIKKYEKK